MNIPEGYKLVPVEPTKKMLGVDTVPLLCLGNPNTPRVIQWRLGLYGSMLAAAPTPPQSIYDETKERELARFSYDADSEFTGGWFDYLYGWLACAQSRAKAGEAGHE